MFDKRKEKRGDDLGSPEPYDRRRWPKDTDRVLIRAKDIGLLLSILALGTISLKIYAKPAQWDQTSRDVDEMKPVVAALVRMASADEAHWQDISRELHEINRSRR